MAVAKHTREYDVAEIVEEDKATVHGVIIDLLPIKSSKNNPTLKYFNAKISDGRKCARMISFEPKLRPDLESSKVEGKTIALVNCKVKPGKFDSTLEVLATNHTEVASSPKKFKLDLTLQGSPQMQCMDELHALPTCHCCWQSC
jgi:hypothetical protein